LKALEVAPRLELAGFNDYHIEYGDGYAVVYFDAGDDEPITRMSVPCLECGRLKCKTRCRKYRRMMRGGLK
jgi:hypothetical protein